MFVILEIAGKQFRAENESTLITPKLNIEGSSVVFDKVMLLEKSEGDVVLGNPYIEGAKVHAKIIEKEVKGDKITVFKKKRRKGYKKTQGHRQCYSKVVIEKIEATHAKSV